MNFRVLISYRGFRICSHAASSHLLGRKHHDTVHTQAMPLQLAIKFAELLFIYRSISLSIQAGTPGVQRDDCFCACREEDAPSLPQAMEKVFTVIKRDNTIDHKLPI